MKRAILITLQVLGWVTFVPLAVAFYLWSLIVLLAFLAASFSPGQDWNEQVKVCAVLLVLALVALALAIVPRKVLRRLEERERAAHGFEPVMNRRQ